MTTVRKPTGPTVVLQVLLLVAIASLAYSQVFLPLTGPGGVRLMMRRYPPSVEVTLDYAKVLKDPTTSPFRFPETSYLAPGDPALEFVLPTRTHVSVYDPDFRERVGLIGTTTLRGLLAIAVLCLLLLMVRTLRSGDPFVPANARRMYAIAATVGIGGPLADLLGQWGRHEVLDNPKVAAIILREPYHLSLLPVAIGLAIAIGAEVFRQGTSLRADVEGLV